MNHYEAKQQARKERLEARADRLKAEAAAKYNAGMSDLRAIPFGQPILVGHHSEKRDRNYRRKAVARIDKAMELNKQKPGEFGPKVPRSSRVTYPKVRSYSKNQHRNECADGTFDNRSTEQRLIDKARELIEAGHLVAAEALAACIALAGSDDRALEPIIEAMEWAQSQ